MSTPFMRRERVASSAGAGTVSFLCGAADAAPVTPMASPGMSIHTEFRVNGREHRVAHDIRASLLDTLRRHNGLTTANPGCGHGQCGACTVRINGEPKLACLTLTVAAQGADITTTEELGPSPPQPHPMSRAFIDC